MKVSSTRINTLLFIVVGVLLSVFINSIDTYALTYSSNVNVQFTFNPTLSVSLSSNDLVISNLAPGTASDSNIITVNIKTNNITGYTINATVGNNTTFDTRDLKHQNSNVVNKFTSVNFGTIVATNTALTDNTWGYSYSLDNGSTWIANTASSTSAGYSGLPLYSDGTNIATLKESTAPPATSSGDDIKFKIAARASNEQSSGEYNNVINFTTVANPEPQLEPINCSTGDVICYSANSLGPVEGTMGEQSASGNSSVTLLASNFSREGYGFAGWSDTYDYATNPNAHFYGPQETITTPADMSAGLPLYAVWVQSAGSMQDDAASVCSNLITASTNGTANLSSVSALTDERDNDTYAIAKLADGNCWMIENLRLADKDSNNNDVILSSTNTNNPSLPLTNIYDTSSTSNHLSPTSSIAYNASTAPEGWCTTVSVACYNQSRIRTDNTANRATGNPNDNTGSMYSYGNYYNWYSATAGNGTFSNQSGEVTGDLCPSGWRLPYGGSSGNGNTSGGFYYLNYKLNNDSNLTDVTASNKLRTYPNNFLYSGITSAASLTQRKNYGYYWSSTARYYFGATDAYSLFFGSSYVYPGTNNQNNYEGLSVRCVAGS